MIEIVSLSANVPNVATDAPSPGMRVRKGGLKPESGTDPERLLLRAV
ncbi:hypothetical protein [Curtobacterium sp. MCSS17_005]|nr:hypothetical protein [Curtobacterium sp. MCSS17_005]WIB34369.1 hypothetical protein DEJ20_07850 [Curtobacterium sp. MCSS17_005]